MLGAKSQNPRLIFGDLSAPARRPCLPTGRRQAGMFYDNFLKSGKKIVPLRHT